MQPHRTSSSRAAVLACLAALAVGGSRANASAYYTATDLGKDARIALDADGRQVVVNPTTGQVTPFTNASFRSDDPYHALPDALGVNDPRREDPGYFRNLPIRWYTRGYTYPVLTASPMLVTASNDAGTVLGGFIDNRDGYSTPSIFAYVQKQADGEFGPIHQLNSLGVGLAPGLQFYLNNRNQILIDDPGRWDMTKSLLDVDTGERANLMDLISPEDQLRYFSQYSRSMGAHSLGLADDGSILMSVWDGLPNNTVILLTPPTPAPEPSTLALIAVAGAGLGYRWLRRSRRIPA